MYTHHNNSVSKCVKYLFLVGLVEDNENLHKKNYLCDARRLISFLKFSDKIWDTLQSYCQKCAFRPIIMENHVTTTSTMAGHNTGATLMQTQANLMNTTSTIPDVSSTSNNNNNNTSDVSNIP